MRNSYAKKIHQKRILMKNEERLALIRRTLTTVYYAAVITLNDSFGFGADRIQRFRDGLDETIHAYGGLMDDVDADYADGKLEQVYQKIMGEKSYDSDRE